MHITRDVHWRFGGEWLKRKKGHSMAWDNCPGVDHCQRLAIIIHLSILTAKRYFIVSDGGQSPQLFCVYVLGM